MTLINIVMFIGGLSMLLFGIQFLADSLCRLADDRLAHIVDEMTSSTLKGILWGTGITSVIQSSSVLTVTVVGMTNAGMIGLRRAIAVIMGANIGTTLTAWILSLIGIESGGEMLQIFRPATVAAIFAVVGVVLLIFVRSERKRLVATVFFSLAILFFGMMTMTEIAFTLAESQWITGLLSGNVHPLLCFGVGILITAALQSSSTTVGILQAVSVAEMVPVAVALPLLFGIEIGACAAAIVSSLGASAEAKRAALAHLLFNVIGVGIYLTLFILVGVFADPAFYDAPISIFGIAMAHSFFNLSVTFLLLPFLSRLENVLYRILPDRNEEIAECIILEKRFLFSPSFAAKHSYNALVEMASLVYENVMDALSLVYAFDRSIYHHVVDNKALVDEYEEKLRRYLTDLSRKELSERDGDALAAMLCSVVMLKRLDQTAVDIGKTSFEYCGLGTGASLGIGLKEILKSLCDVVPRAFGGFEHSDFDSELLLGELEHIEELCGDGRRRCRAKAEQGEYNADTTVALITYIGYMERIAECCEELSSYIHRSDFSLCESQREFS